MNNEITPDQFSTLLGRFNKLTHTMPEAKKIEKDLIEIKEAASLSIEMTGRQKEAIIDRCNNYLTGKYGAKPIHDYRKVGLNGKM